MGGRHSEKQGDTEAPPGGRWTGRLSSILPIVISTLGIGVLLLFNDFWLEHIGYGLVLLSALLLTPLCLLLKKPQPISAASGSGNADPLPQPEQGIADDNAELTTTDGRSGANGSRKILLVSGDRSDRHAIRSYLDSWGAETEVAPNAVRSFYRLISAADRGSPFHTVIIDQGQFDMDPGQFSIALRSEPLLQNLYLILIGPNTTNLQRNRLQLLGYTRLLPVPLDKTLLFDALHSMHSMPEQSGGQVVRIIDHYAGANNLQPLSILLAENDSNDQQRIRSILHRQGHQVFMVDSGAKVLDALDSYHFDLAMVSAELEEITGLEAFKLYRFTRIDKQWTPFILLLERPTRSLVQSCVDAGVNATLEKGSDPRRIIDLVNRVIRESNDNIGVNTGSSYTYPSATHSGPKADGSSLDFHRLRELERLGSGASFLASLIDSFNRDNREFLNQMEEAIKNGNLSRFRDLGHAMRDSAGSLGALKLYQLGTAATRLRPADFPATASELIQKITECCRLSNNALQTYLLEKEGSESDSRNE